MSEELIETQVAILDKRISLLQSEKEHMGALLLQIKKMIHTWDQVEPGEWVDIHIEIESVMEEVGL